MIKRLIPCFVFFVTSLLPVFCEPFRFSHAPEAALSFTITDDGRYGPKLQISELITYSLAFRFFDYIGFSIGGVFTNVHASSLSGGFQYRGYTAFGLESTLFGVIPLFSSTQGLKGDLRLFVSFLPFYARYYLIDSVFFFTALRTGAGGELYFTPFRNWSLTAGIPVTINFRRDTAYSVAPGLSVTFRHYIVPLPKKDAGR